MEENRESREDAKNRGQIVCFVLIALTAVFVFGILSMNLVTVRIINFAIENMKMLSDHDAYSIENTVRQYGKLIDGIAGSVGQPDELNVQTQMKVLKSKKEVVGSSCIELVLVAEDAFTIDSGMSAGTDEKIRTICSQMKQDFICHYQDEDFESLEQKEVLLLGRKVSPFTLEGHTYDFLAAKIEIDILQQGIKLDSYEAQGHSHVIDFDGYYLINAHRDLESEKVENFYETMDRGTLKGGMTISKMKEQMERKENLIFQYVDSEGVTDVIACTYMEVGDWYFVSVVPKNVFVRQSQTLMELFMFFMVVIFVILFTVGIIIFRRRSKMLAMERHYRMELTEALNMAQAANRAKTTFLNNMSHDIRTPMNAIIGFTALAITHIDTKDRVADYLEKISKSSNHLLSLINDVLDMSRIESGNVSIDAKPENLAEILHGLKDIILADINAKQLELFIDVLDVWDECIICDKLRLNQVLLNLTSNALKYTNPGGIVSIRVIEKGYTESGRGIYEFHVKDTGIGMSPEFVQTIFEPFTREKTSTVSGIQGTGLGMAITKNIVNMMGGTITVTSEPGVGSEFIVSFEFEIQEGDKEPKVIGSLEGLRGLIVDDDMNTCQSAAAMLRQIGMRSEWCTHGKEAVARTEEAIKIHDHFQVYIIDWLMPDMNGIEIARRVRKIAGNDVPIILLSAYDWTDMEEEAREAGITDFISKPMFLSDLFEKLSRACGEGTQEPVPQTAEKKVTGVGKRLLLVEDIELNREIAVEILGQEGFEVDSAENGSVAVDKIEKSQPGYYDAVLMDVQMPIMNGYEAAKAIRALQNPALAAIPIIAMTANAFEEDKKAALEAGMNSHVSKPIDVGALLEALEEVI